MKKASLSPEEKFMISNVVDFGDALSKDIMIPRADVVSADVNSTYKELVDIFKSETYTRIPIYEDSKENIIGILNIKDLFFYRELLDIRYLICEASCVNHCLYMSIRRRARSSRR